MRDPVANRVAAGVITTLALCGCSSADAERQLPIRLERVTSDDQIVSPIRDLLPDVAEARLILLAHDTLVADCVSGKGLTASLSAVNPLPWVSDLLWAAQTPVTRGPVDPQRMARYGYHDPEHGLESAVDVRWVGPSTSEDVVRACDERVTEELGGEPPFSLLGLFIETGKRTGSDPRRAGPQRAWSDCMKDRGFDYKQTGAPWFEFAIGPDATQVVSSRGISAEEISVATADAECQAISRSTDTDVALAVAYEEQALEEHAEEVAAYRSYLKELLRRSAEIVATMPAPANRREAKVDP